MLRDLELMIILEEELTAEEFDLFMCIYYHNMTFKETAEDLGIDVIDVVKRDELLLKKIKEILC